jgi:hypothetical protein
MRWVEKQSDVFPRVWSGDGLLIVVTGIPDCRRGTILLYGKTGNQTKRKAMKTIGKIALIVTTLIIGISSSLSASPRGKHAVDFAIHKHGASHTSHVDRDYVQIKRIGPPGKGIVRTNTSRAK